MIIILHDHDQTIRVGHVPPAIVLDLADRLSGTSVQLRIRPDDDAIPPVRDPGYFGLAVALARQTWRD